VTDVKFEKGISMKTNRLRARVSLRIPFSQGYVFIVGALLLICSTPVNPASQQDAEVGGVWEAKIDGTQQSTGYPQSDEAILSLTRSGSKVTGTMLYAGFSEEAKLTGTVSGRTVRFTAVFDLGPNCKARIEVYATVASNQTMQGRYSAVTCEDAVRGTLTASKR